MRTVQQALIQEYEELERMSQSTDPVERALGALYLALVPQFNQTLAELSATIPGNHLVAASMQALAQIVSGLMIAAHKEEPQLLYNIWQPSFERLVLKNLSLFENGHEASLPASLRLWAGQQFKH